MDAQKLLSPYIAGGSTRENGDIDAHCPLHNDRRRSAVLNFEEGVWYCNAEGVGGSITDLVARREEWVDPPRSNGRAIIRKPTAASAAGLPSEAEVMEWRKALRRDSIAMDDLKAARGIWTKTADYYELGWSRAMDAYTIPVRDVKGRLLNVRRYQIRVPEGRRKIWGITGHNSPVLYPFSALSKAKRSRYIIICEGELDAIILNQYNFRAITRTGAARIWNDGWSKLLTGLVVYVCHDCDSTGQDANRKVARSVVRVAEEVRTIRLPYPIAEKGGKDVTDWWIEHDGDRDAFQRLLDEAQPFDESMTADPEEIDPSEASVVDAFDSRRSGKPLSLTVTVKGKHEPGYTIPRKVAFRCTRDAGKMCEFCPMKIEEEGIDLVVAGADPAILEMVDATKAQVNEVLRRMVGIPKCPKVAIKIQERQAIEVLYARPSVEHNNGSSNADYKNIKLLSVGRHDTSPNQTVRVVGALHPDPRKQRNEFLTWDLSKLETSIDRFEMDSELMAMLSSFQPGPGEKPLAKLREIADDLAEHVTFIYGRPELHAAMDLVFHSVTSFDFDGKRMNRGWLELLVVGDTRTGKSEVASRLVRHLGGGEVVSCESATLAGVLGGLQQFGANKEWIVNWGFLPLNDRRLVVLDEITGLSQEDIGSMSSIRSSGIAELNKIQQERTHARTRLIWLGNPRGARMSDYTYGVQAIRPLIGNAEDIARFDFAMSVSSSDVKSSEINRSRPARRLLHSREAYATLLRWAWSRTPEQVVFDEGTQEAVYRAANDLGRRYVEDPPLIQAANVREKIARLSVALAARLFSTDPRGENVIVRRAHVRAAVAFLDRLYSMEGFGYAERSTEILQDAQSAKRNIELTKKYLKNRPGLPPFLRSQGKFRRQDLEEILNIEREEANVIISQLYDMRMIYKEKGDVKLSPTLHEILREGEQ